LQSSPGKGLREPATYYSLTISGNVRPVPHSPVLTVRDHEFAGLIPLGCFEMS
jgi:hypothetical protein